MALLQKRIVDRAKEMISSLGRCAKFSGRRSKQSGQALIVFFVVIALIASTVVISFFDSDDVKIERDKKTAVALAEAKAALIGFAAASPLTGSVRPGDLPCPDSHSPGTALEGSSSTPCGGNAIGRLPWKTLGVADLRDGYGERLWYAVSSNFKNSNRTTCALPSDAGCLNSDTGGTITLRDSSGTVIKNGAAGKGVAAVVLSPGSSITRTDGVVQDRGCGGCNIIASNYLDIVVGTDDNASFTNSSATDGFISGPVKDASGATVTNDTLAIVSIEELMPLLEKRVANEALHCLKEYALNNSGGVDRHPWSTDSTNPASYPNYNDSRNHRLGRIPDITFDETYADGSANPATPSPPYKMSDTWPGSCSIVSGSTGWWMDWKALVFYAVSYNRDPANTFPVPSCSANGPNACLTINTPSATITNQGVVVIVAGKTLTGQSRATNIQRGTLSNYLEGDNVTSTATTRNLDGEDTIFEQKPATSTFNDVVVYY